MSKMPSPTAVLKHRTKLRNANEVQKENLKPLDILAIKITDHVGTMGFFLIIFCWTIIWLSWNFLAPKSMQFDPPMSFVFYLFISNVIQICLMPLIMVGQNLQSRHSEIRAENDFEINCQAEREIQVVLEHLEHQNKMLFALMEKVGINVDEVVAKLGTEDSLAQD